jgi:hypothetical protein
MNKLRLFAVALVAGAAPSLCAAQSAHWTVTTPFGETSGAAYQQICSEHEPFTSCDDFPSATTATFRIFGALNESGNGFDEQLTFPSLQLLDLKLAGDTNDQRSYTVTVTARSRDSVEIKRGVLGGGYEQTTAAITGAWTRNDLPQQKIDLSGVFKTFDNGEHGGLLNNNLTPETPGSVVFNDVKINDVIELTPRVTIAEHGDRGLSETTVSDEMGALNGDDGLFFTVQAVAAPVPEPSLYAMLLAGLGLAGCLNRAQRRRVVPREMRFT